MAEHEVKCDGTDVKWFFILLPFTLFLPLVFMQSQPQKFTIWMMSDPHVIADLPERRVLVEAFNQMESVDWDVALILGDFAAGGWPTQAECDEIQDQFSDALITSTHTISDVYVLAGNHDADTGMQWFINCLNPKSITGRTRPVTGWHDFYYFDQANIRLLMMSDKNDQARDVGGRGGEFNSARGGYPAGKMRGVTFDWFKAQVIDNPDKILIAAHHHMLRGTTTGTERWGGVYWGYHGYFREGWPECASFICFVGNEKNEGQPIIDFLNQNPGKLAMWLGGHTHLREPMEVKAGRSPIETTHGGTHFINAGALTGSWGAGVSMSTVLEFTQCSDQVRVRRFLHQEWNGAPVGFYAPAEMTLTLPRAYDC